MSSKSIGNTAKARRLARRLSTLSRQEALKLLAHMSLAAAGLRPAMSATSEALLTDISRYFSNGDLQPDTTKFAGLCLGFSLSERDLPLRSYLDEILADAEIRAAFQDPLFAADTFEWLSQESQSNRHRATQFFTPRWVADLIVAELLADFEAAESENFRLLDPACGGGHLLVAALEHLSGACPDRESKIARLRLLLASTLTGIDIDSNMTALCALSIYLCARRLSKSDEALCELPLPALYLACDEQGSLALPTAGPQSFLPILPVMPVLSVMHGQFGKKSGEADSRQASTKSERIEPASFDAVVMNPPYQSTRTMDSGTAAYLKRHYPSGSGDLYTAFIELAMRFLKEGGRLSTICQQSLLSIQRYQKLRLDLLQKSQFLSCLTLGTGVFPSLSGEKCNTAILVLGKGTNAADKPLKLLELNGKKGVSGMTATFLSQSELKAMAASIAGNPLAFHCPQAILQIFIREKAIGQLPQFSIVNGLFTCNNKLFVKEQDELHRLQDNGTKYVPYDKGGGDKWYQETKYRLAWGEDGEAIRAYRAARGQSRSLPGEKFYFKDGVTYSYIGTKGFTARLLSEGAIFDIASSAIFSDQIDRLYTVGFLNSALAIYLLSILNPTVNFQIGDLRRLPFKLPEKSLSDKIGALSREAIEIVKAFKEGQLGLTLARERETAVQESIDRLIFDLYAIAPSERELILSNRWVQNARARSF